MRKLKVYLVIKILKRNRNKNAASFSKNVSISYPYTGMARDAFWHTCKSAHIATCYWIGLYCKCIWRTKNRFQTCIYIWKVYIFLQNYEFLKWYEWNLPCITSPNMKIPWRRIFSREKIVTLFAIIFNPLSFWNEISDQQGPILYINHWLLTIVRKTMHNIYNLACSTHNLILLFSDCKRILSRVMPCKHSIVFISYIISSALMLWLGLEL